MNAITPHVRALSHPLTVTSVGILLLNDHVLKATVPSWFTGKLSDFAGLFFFPFVLAAVLALPNPILRWPARRVLALACGLTALWFSLIKTMPWANALTVTALTQLLDQPVQIILDPTDLLALPMIGLAWGLWNRLERSSTPHANERPGYLALGVAVLAALASSPCAGPVSAQQVMVVNNTIYVGSGQGPNAVISRYDPVQFGWYVFEPVPAEVAAETLKTIRLPRQDCDPQNPLVCYRIDGRPRVEASEDGGKTWTVAWQIPWGRAGYMRRLHSVPLSCRSTQDLEFKSYDLAFLPNGSPHTVVVAMGYEGVVVREANGQWKRQAAYGGYIYYEPTPFAVEDPAELIFTLAPENATVVIAFIVTLILFPILGHKRLLHNAVGAARVMTVAFAVAFSLLGAWLPFVFWAYGLIPEYLLALALALAWAVMAYGLGWRAIRPPVDETV